MSGNVAVDRQTHVPQLEGRHEHLVGAPCGLGQREQARLDTKGGRFLALFFFFFGIVMRVLKWGARPMFVKC